MIRMGESIAHHLTLVWKVKDHENGAKMLSVANDATQRDARNLLRMQSWKRMETTVKGGEGSIWTVGNNNCNQNDKLQL